MKTRPNLVFEEEELSITLQSTHLVNEIQKERYKMQNTLHYISSFYISHPLEFVGKNLWHIIIRCGFPVFKTTTTIN